LRALLSDRPIAFHPMMARVLGGINEALLFQQLAYWSDKGDDPDWIYKSQVELEAETTLSEYQQLQARKRLKALGVLDDQRRGVPARLYYRVNWEAVFRLLEEPESRFQETQNLSARDARIQETENLDSKDVASKNPGNSAPNSEMTSESTQRDLSKGQPKYLVKREDRKTIERYATDLAAELHDESDLRSTVTRMISLYVSSGVTLNEFLDDLQESRRITQKHSGSIRKETSDGFGLKNKMPYFLEVLEHRIELRVG
jgi:hypothetical protein